MGILSKLTRAMRIRKIRREARQKAYEALCLSPLKYSRAIAEIDCIIDGHKWSSEFDPKTEINKKFKDRVYCKHCGVRWHQHAYKEIKNS